MTTPLQPFGFVANLAKWLPPAGSAFEVYFAADLDQIDDLHDVSDEAAEAAAGNEALPQ